MRVTQNQEKLLSNNLAEEAQERGENTPSFVAALFNGELRWDLIHPFPEQDAAEKKIGDEFIDKIHAVLEEYIDPNEVDRLGEIPEEALLTLSELGCFGMRIPKEYGGLGFSETNYHRVIGFVSSYCSSTAVWLAAHQSAGAVEPLLLFGTETQKRTYLPRLARGALSAFALTEPSVGSDPAMMKTLATPSADGASYRLNGEKLWCTNGPSAELMLVVALAPPRKGSGQDKPQPTAFLVETSQPGFEVRHISSLMGIRGVSTGLLRFRNFEVPASNMVGELGQGLKIAMTTLNTARLTLPAALGALGKLSVHYARDWCRKRVQWGVPIGRHQAVAVRTAHMAACAFAMDSISTQVNAMVDKGGADFRVESAMAKYYCCENAWRICDGLVQVRGGRGVETAESLASLGEDPVPAERMLRDALVARLLGGTSDIMRLFIAREVMDIHVKRFAPIVEAGKNHGPLFWEAARYYAKWYAKQWIPAFAPGGARHLSRRNRAHLRFIAHTSRRLSRALFHTMLRYRQRLEHEQVAIRALVDIGAQLFAMSSVLSRTEHLAAKGAVDVRALQELADLFCTEARTQVAQSFSLLHHRKTELAHAVAESFLSGSYAWLSSDIHEEFPPQFQSKAGGRLELYCEEEGELSSPEPAIESRSPRAKSRFRRS